MYMGAIAHSDGIIRASDNINSKVDKFIDTQKKKLILESPQGESENLIDIYEEFYHKVIDGK